MEPVMPKSLGMVRDGTPGLLLIAAVIRTSSVEYTLYCDDPFKLIARLPRIRDMIHARVETLLLNEHEIRVTLTPVDGALTIGLTPVRGERLFLTTDQARAALGQDLAFAQRQTYALWSPVPNIVAPGGWDDPFPPLTRPLSLSPNIATPPHPHDSNPRPRNPVHRAAW